MEFIYTIVDYPEERTVYTLKGAYVYDKNEDIYYMHKFVKMKDGEPVYESEITPCSKYAFRKAIREVRLETKIMKEWNEKQMWKEIN